jgi:hypothetical protein
MTPSPAAAIIGAGSSGIAAAKALHERGIPFDCFEKSDRVGGNWVFGNKNGLSAAYRSLHINTSRERMAYSDYPMPAHYPDFPHHAQIAAYFDAYVDHFGFRDRIAFDTGVERATLGPDGVWTLALDGEAGREVRRYDALLVANGHHWHPRWPDPPLPGRFDGVQMHSHAYVDSAGFAGKRVVVLGMGNSAMDIAVEASYVAEKVYLAARRGAHVIPKYLFGNPLDQQGAWDPSVPFHVRQRRFEEALLRTVGRVEDYGLPAPDHRILEAHPTISSGIFHRLKAGAIVPKPAITELLGDRVRFADGSVEPADAIVYCTGYRVTFPFFDPDFLAAPDNDLPLFRRVFKPRVPNLCFIGLVQPLGAIMPIAEAQGRWVADYLRGDYALPTPAAMRADLERERAAMFARYVPSARHTMQIDFDRYLYELALERRAGARRARRRGHRAPIPPRAWQAEAAQEPLAVPAQGGEAG